MATIVRLKRRRDEDPLEMLLLATKKQKQDNQKESKSNTEHDKEVFKFAGTVSSKGDGISYHVREAIRKEKLEREYRQHQSNILGTVKQEARQQRHGKSQQNRFKVISKQRALDLNCLDVTRLSEDICQKCGLIKRKLGTTTDCSERPTETVTNRTADDSGISEVKEKSKDVKNEDVISYSEERKQCCGCDNVTSVSSGEDSNCAKITSEKSCEKGKNNSKEHAKETDSDRRGMVDPSRGAGDGQYCLVDVESEHLVSRLTVGDSLADKITCNSEPMEREIVSERSNNDDYVYDIYYTNSRQFDFRMFERDLTLEAFSSDLMFDQEMDVVDDEFVYEDDEDENVESNWRNDYPEEDPRYFENENSNYNYENELDDYLAFETETGNQLSDWMSWRCNIDGGELSSEDEDVEHYGDEGTGYGNYYRHVQGDKGEDDDESEDSGK